MRILLTPLLFLVQSFSADGQLKSVTLNTYFKTATAQTAEGIHLPVQVIQTERWVNGFDFFGKTLSSFTAVNSGHFACMLKKTLPELQQEGLYIDRIVQIQGYDIEEGGSYNANALIRNYQEPDVLSSKFLLAH